MMSKLRMKKGGLFKRRGPVGRKCSLTEGRLTCSKALRRESMLTRGARRSSEPLEHAAQKMWGWGRCGEMAKTNPGK